MRLTTSWALAVAATVVLASPGEAQKKRRDVITRAEIQASAQKDQDIVQAIRALRPHFLEAPRSVRSLGNSMMYPIVVYVDRIRLTGVDDLATLMAADVEEVRYLDPTRSQNDYGITANGGALVLKRVKTTTAERPRAP